MDTLQQVQQLRDRIKELEFERDSLKCCGNCGNSRSMSVLQPNSFHHATYCATCINNSNWVEESK